MQFPKNDLLIAVSIVLVTVGAMLYFENKVVKAIPVVAEEEKNEVEKAPLIVEKTKEVIIKDEAEINRLTSEIKQRNETIAALTKERDSYKLALNAERLASKSVANRLYMVVDDFVDMSMDSSYPNSLLNSMYNLVPDTPLNSYPQELIDINNEIARQQAYSYPYLICLLIKQQFVDPGIFASNSPHCEQAIKIGEYLKK